MKDNMNINQLLKQWATYCQKMCLCVAVCVTSFRLRMILLSTDHMSICLLHSVCQVQFFVIICLKVIYSIGINSIHAFRELKVTYGTVVH